MHGMGVYVEYIKAMIYFTWFKQHVKQESELNDSLYLDFLFKFSVTIDDRFL